MSTATVSVIVNNSINKVWESLTLPDHIVNWNFAHESWCCPSATNDLKVGGKMVARMEARDGSFGFDFSGTYTEINAPLAYSYKLDDDRMVYISLEEKPEGVFVKEVFDLENENSAELQQQGWQAILDNFKKYTETL